MMNFPNIGRVMLENATILPRVGEGATVHYAHDRQAATVVEISNDWANVWVQEDHATRLDSNGENGPQSYAFTRDLDGYRSLFTLRESGEWVADGYDDNGPRVTFGERDHFWDFIAF